MPKPSGPTSEEIRRTYRKLQKTGRENRARVWLAIAEKISSPRRRRVEVNLKKIDKLTTEGEFVAVPGKVLGSGEVTKPVTVAALKFSAAARVKIERAGGRVLSLIEAAAENPEGKGIRIVA